MTQSFGTLLRNYRKQRRHSQLSLSLELGVSSRHICFLETEKSAPSREMVLRIGEFFQLPKREINRALCCAGFAQAYGDLSPDHADLSLVNSAIRKILSNHLPYPALVLNRDWDIVDANKSAMTLVGQLGFSHSNNLVEGLIADDPTTSKIVNWHESAGVVLRRLRYEISTSVGEVTRLRELERKLSACCDSVDDLEDGGVRQVLDSTQFKFDEITLSYFSVIAQLGSVQDVRVSELKIELMFPADSATTLFHEASNSSG